MSTPTLKPNAAIEQSKRKLAAQLTRIRARRAAALSRVNAHYDDIEQDWYATVPPEWHVAIREAAARAMVRSCDITAAAFNWQKVAIVEGEVVVVDDDGKKIARGE